MPDDKYPVQYDALAGYARVDLKGALSAQKIRNTFALIALNADWAKAQRKILWRALEAVFPPSFEFADIFQTTRLSKTLTKPGKSAIVVAESAGMIAKVAHFYRNIALASTQRQVEIFFDEDEALAWLEEEIA
jgi:hypothetical protein